MQYEVTLLTPPTEITAESIQQWIADSVYPIRGKEPVNNAKLFNRLLKESFGDTASRVMQYIPCKLSRKDIMNLTPVPSKMYGFWTGLLDRSQEPTYWTTARELFNWGWTLEEILPTIDFTHYKAVRVRAPRFIYNQLQTHDNVTSVSFSARYNEGGSHGYWMPPEFVDSLIKDYGRASKRVEDAQILWNDIVENTSPKELKHMMKEVLGIKRTEIWNRGADSLEYVEFTLGSFTQHEHYWPHFINQRGIDSHTQEETRDVAKLIASAIGIEIKEL